MLEARNIHKKYGVLDVLKGVDITINPGEIVSIVGPSGSGKSTLLHILGTLDQADQGFVEISGVRIESKPNLAVTRAPWWKRLVNAIIDSILILLLTGLIFLPVTGNFSFLLAFSDLTSLVLGRIGIFVLYYFLFEGIWGRTPGKWLTGTRVMMAEDYTKPAPRTILARTLFRLIPLEPFSLFGARPAGWHDSISNTIVTDARIGYQKKGRLTPNELAAFRNRRIGFIFQFHHLLPEFTALENVCIAGWLHNNKKDVKKRAEHLLTILGLSHRLHNKPNQLSGGEQQRVAVARALINQPDIVFADEPTGNLDTANARELHQLFFDLRKEFNQTFLIVTHNEELAQLSDRTLIMKDGKMVEEVRHQHVEP